MAKIMIVDDATMMRTFLKNIVIESGHEVVAEARTGKEAVDLYAQHHPDLITMDITMPDMDGITAVKQILSFDQKAKIIMCSAMSQQKLMLEAIQAGARDYIVKPFQKFTVVETINHILSLNN